MSDLPPDLPIDVVDKRECKSALSISIGAGIAFILGFLPFLNACCINFIIAAFVTVWHFTKVNEVTIAISHGVKLAFVSTFLGALILLFANNMVYYNQFGTDLAPIKEYVLESVEKTGSDDYMEIVENAFPDELTPGVIAGIIAFQVAIFALSSLVAAAIGGSLAANLFKKGPLAQ